MSLDEVTAAALQARLVKRLRYRWRSLPSLREAIESEVGLAIALVLRAHPDLAGAHLEAYCQVKAAWLVGQLASRHRRDERGRQGRGGPAGEPDPARVALGRDYWRVSLARLGPHHRAAIEALYQEGLTLREAGRKLGVHFTTVGAWERAALEEIRRDGTPAPESPHGPRLASRLDLIAG